MRYFGFEFTLECFVEVNQEDTTDMKELVELIEEAKNGNVRAIADLMQRSITREAKSKLTTRNFSAPELKGR